MALPDSGLPSADLAPIEVRTTVSDTGAWARKLSITVPSAEVAKSFNQVVGQLAGRLRLPGFRPGKAPRAVAEKRFGAEIKQQVKADLVERALRTAVKNEKLDVVGTPGLDPERIEVERGRELQFDVEVEIKPTFELGTYRGLQVEQEEVEVFPEEIEEQLRHIAERFAEMEDAPADAVLGEKDVAEGPVTFRVDGNVVHTDEEGRLMCMNGHVLGAHAHVGDQWLLGAKAGEKRKVEVQALSDAFPVEELRGKPAAVEIEIEIKKIRRAKTPPLDDELARKMEMKDLAALKERVNGELRERLARATTEKTRDALVKKIIEASPFELPKRLRETYQGRLAQGNEQYMARMGLSDEFISSKEKELRERTAEQAEHNLRRHFVLDAICAKEGIEAGEEELDEEIVRQARQRGMRAGELFQRLEEEGGLGQLTQNLKAQKALDLLVEHAEIKIVPRQPPEKDKQDEAGSESSETKEKAASGAADAEKETAREAQAKQPENPQAP